MNVVEKDFDYYKDTMKKMYRSYFLKRIILISLAILLLFISTMVFSNGRIFNIFLLFVLFSFIIYLFKKMNEFEGIFDSFLKMNISNLKVKEVQESEYTYNIINNGLTNVYINKEGVRNLPSNDKKYTIMVGFTKGFFSKEPFNIVYYDILDITYEEKFRLKRNGYNKISRLPRFLRRFTLKNLFSSSKNIISFIFGNIFVIYILVQLITLLISLFKGYY